LVGQRRAGHEQTECQTGSQAEPSAPHPREEVHRRSFLSPIVVIVGGDLLGRLSPGPVS
jgi:hypothetical protein